jgi:hypothetical protein
MPSVTRKRPKLGDIVEIKTPDGLAYAQFVNKHDQPPNYGPLIRVLPGLYKSRPSDFFDLVSQPERFLVFFPLGPAVSRGIVTVVANEPIPDHLIGFPILRSPGARDASGRILNWWLWDGRTKWRVDELSADQRKLSLAVIWNDTLLIQRIVEGWSPEREQ